MSPPTKPARRPRGRAKRDADRGIGAATAAATLALCAALAACESPFKGEPQRPKDQSGWQLDEDKDIPDQEQLDLPDEGFDDEGPPGSQS